MFKRLGLHSVWSRLLGTLAIVVLPTAVLIIALAYSLFGATLAALQTTETAAASGRVGELRAWLDAAGRSLANEAVAARYVPADRCAGLARTFLDRNAGFSGVRFFDEAGAPCEAGEKGAPPLARADTRMQPPAGADYRLDIFKSRLWIVADMPGGSPPKPEASLLLVDAAVLDERLRADAALGETHVALIDGEGDFVAHGGDSDDTRWLPAAPLVDVPSGRWRARDRLGTSASFFIASIGSSGLFVLMRFDDRSLTAARYRLFVLCVAQLAMLGVLAFAYLATVRRDVVRWIQAIDAAARAHGRDPESPVKAPVDPTMPSELHSFAQSFNAMADGALAHQRALKTSLVENRALMLEMHHRIKNSLQVIQSYLALIRRASERTEAAPLARIEARVGVLAIAYRLALTPSGIKPIEVRPFLDEIISASIAGLRGPRQRVARDLAWNGELGVDQAIALGLGLVEALVAGFAAEGSTYVGVFLADRGADGVELTVENDGAAAALALPEKIVKGLAGQLGATMAPPPPGAVLVWRFQP